MRGLLVFLAACGFHSSGGMPDGSTGGGDGSDTGDGSSGSGTAITLTLTNRPNNAATYSFVVAYQDGSGPWTVAPAPTGDTYTFTVNAPSYGVAWTCAGIGGGTANQLRTVTEAHFAVAERTS